MKQPQALHNQPKAVFQIRVFGEPDLCLDGSPLPIRLRPRCFVLLAYLAHHRNRSHERAAIATLLWPDDTEEDARSNLRRHLHIIASVIPNDGAPLIDSGRTTIRWNSEAPISVDLVEFDTLSSSRETYDAAIERYRGEFLAGLDGDWVYELRESLRLRYVDMLLTQGEHAMLHGDFNRALAFAVGTLAADEWREEAVRMKMSALYRLGDRPGALGAYRHFAGALQLEMGVEPMLDTVALNTSILANVPLTLLAPHFDSYQEQDTLGTLPFIGRIADVDRLRSAWIRAARTNGSAVFIRGEAGIGKSRLAHHLAIHAKHQGGCVLVGNTSPQESTPYQSITAALRNGLSYLAHAAIDDVWLASLSELLPEIHELRPNLAAAEPLAPENAAARILEAFIRCFGAIARLKPVLLILEDIQWAGDATLNALLALARRSAAMPMLLLATERTGEGESETLARVRTTLAREHRASLRSIGSLEVDDIIAVTSDTALADVPLETLEEAARIAGGHPLFLTLLLRAYRESGVLPHAMHEVHSIGEAVAMRLDALDDRARVVGQAGAAIGAPFDAGFIARIIGWENAEIYDALDSLIDAGIVRETIISLEYTFTHELIERALYDSLDQEARVLRHRRIAAMLEGRNDPYGAAAAAHHWSRAGNASRARSSFRLAMEHALTSYAWKDAHQHGHAALELCDTDDDRLLTLLALSRIGRYIDNSAMWDRDVTALDAVAARIGTPIASMQALLERAKFARYVGDRASQRSSLDQMLEIAKSGGTSSYRVEALLELGHYFMDIGDPASSASVLDDMLASSSSDDLSLERRILALTHRAHALIRIGEFDAAVSTADTARAMGHTASSLSKKSILLLDCDIAMARRQMSALAHSARELVKIANETGDSSLGASWLFIALERWPDEARRESERALEPAHHHGSVARQLYLVLNRGHLEWTLGRFDLAITFAERARALAENIGQKVAIGLALGNLADALLGKGDLAEALRVANEARDSAAGLGDPRVLGAALETVGKIEFALGNRSSAIESLHRAVELARRSHFVEPLVGSLTALANALLTSDPREAHAIAAEIDALVAANIEEQVRPTEICAVLSQVYECHGDEAQARAWALRGRQLISDVLEHISDEPTKSAFRALQFNQLLMRTSNPPRSEPVLDGMLETSPADELSPERRIEALTQRGHALIRVGEYDAAVNAADTARAMRDSATLPAKKAILRLDCDIATARHNMTALAASARELMKIDCETGDSTTDAASRLLVALERWPDEARSVSDNALEVAQTRGRRGSLLSLLLNRGHLEWTFGRFDLALAFAERARTLAEDIGQKMALSYALGNVADALLGKGDFNAALRTASEARISAEGLDDPRLLGEVLLSIGQIELALGDRPSAIASLRRAVGLAQRSHWVAPLVSALTSLAHTLAAVDEREACSIAANIVALVSANIEEQERPTRMCAMLSQIYGRSGDNVQSSKWALRGRQLCLEILEYISDEPTKAAFRALQYNQYLFAQTNSIDESL